MSTGRDVSVRWRFASQQVEDPAAMAQDLRRNGLNREASELLKCNSILLARGRHPSHGCVAMLKSEYDKILKPHDCIHTLTVDAEITLQVKRLCVTNVTALVPGFKQGKIVVVPVGPVPAVIPPGIPETVDTTWCIVEFSDAREYAGEFSAVDAQYNLREASNETFPTTFSVEEPFTYKEICEEIWKSLKDLFGFDLIFHVEDSKPELSPENMKFLGISAWDAFWVVMDLAGWTFYLEMDNKGDMRPHVIQPGDEEDDDEFKRLIALPVRAGLSNAGNIKDEFLPESIDVTSTQRNYQFEPIDENTLTAGDHYRRFPTSTETFTTSAILREFELPVKEIAADTTVQLWSTLQLFFDDRGEESNEDLIKAHSKDLAKRYLQFRAESQIREYEWIGLPSVSGSSTTFRPSKVFSGVLIHNHGPLRTLGLNSSVGEPRWVDGHVEWELGWKGEEARPGAITLDAVPHGREIFGVLTGAESDSPGGDDNGPLNLQPNRFGSVQIEKGVASETLVSWSAVGNVRAVNATGGPIRFGIRVFCKFNYQLGTGGEWCIVAARGSPEGGDDWLALCISKGFPVEAADDTEVTIVNRRSMLRLIRPEVGLSDPDFDPFANSPGGTDFLPAHLKPAKLQPASAVSGFEPPDSSSDITEKDLSSAVIIDIQHGPPNTILWTGDSSEFRERPGEQETEDDVIYWSNGPTVNSMRLLSGVLQLGSHDLTSEIRHRGGGETIKLVLPPLPTGLNQHLQVSAIRGDCVTTDWTPSGVDCTISVAEPACRPTPASAPSERQFIDDYFCQMVSNCSAFGNPWGSNNNPEDLLGPPGEECRVKGYVFKQGVLTQGEGCFLNTGGFAVECQQPQIRHWNPCRDIPDQTPGDSPSPGEDPDEPPFEPQPPDPEDELPPLIGDPTIPVDPGSGPVFP